MDFSIVTKAGISKSEFAKLMKTSRTTVHSWMNGGGVHAMIQGRLRRTLSLMALARTAGDLPLPPSVPRKDRVKAIVAVLRKHNAVTPTAD